ncbi:hypothetical protein COV18_03025 [Candidatus Woesearchaeota archaeon CG10_big_fil_rev_8_21_14_0_10_37_12]|nr:MAG: hypothetical protein COV18_03025 [Candidatus Woesearchaeota archaeon CG10_big_fil_rev_8_21_14_0_10_37_12]
MNKKANVFLFSIIGIVLVVSVAFLTVKQMQQGDATGEAIRSQSYVRKAAARSFVLPAQITFCGDGIVQSPNSMRQNEQCDPPASPSKQCRSGNTFLNCNANCRCDTGAAPAQQTVYMYGQQAARQIPTRQIQTQQPTCGNGVLDVREKCDPGNQAQGISGVACSGGQTGYACNAQCLCMPPSVQQTQQPVQQPVCGNNMREGTEQCDGTDSTACPGLCTNTCVCGQAQPTQSLGASCARPPATPALNCDVGARDIYPIISGTSTVCPLCISSNGVCSGNFGDPDCVAQNCEIPQSMAGQHTCGGIMTWVEP